MSDPVPTLSIVTPSFNQGRYLDATIQSVISQEGDFRIEYIIMDGGSTDGSLDIVRKYDALLASGEFPVKCRGVRLVWHSGKDAGQYEAINRGFTLSSGEIMGWINSDDIYLPGAFNTIAMVFGRYPQVHWITAHSTRIDAEGRITGVETSSLFPRSLVAKGVFNGRSAPFIQQESTLWRRSLWERLDGKLGADYRYAADYELWKRFAALTDLVKVQTQIGAFRSHADQKTASISRYYQEVDAMGGVSPLDRITTRLTRLLSRIYLFDRVCLMHRSALTVYYSRKEGDWLLERVRGRTV